MHIRHIAEAAVPGYRMITPYEQVGGGEPRYLHFYEMATDDPEATYQAMTPLVQDRLGPPGTPGLRRLGLAPRPAHRLRQHLPPRRRL